jgi:cardiolipin synthase
MELLLTALASIVGTIVVLAIGRNLISPEKKIAYRIRSEYGVDEPQFVRSMSNLLGPPFVGGNCIEAFHNGDEIFPAMLQAIREARVSIAFETFIYWSGEIGRQFADALAERAQAGVQVHIILDGFGALTIDKKYVGEMEDAGCHVEWYNPLRWYTLSRLTNRTHRKLLVVDGRIGFTGGVGIADEWQGRAESPDHWRDDHFRVTGPAVAQVQAAFTDNWMKTHSDVLHGGEYFPAAEKCGDTFVQVFKSSPREGSQSVRLMYMMTIAAARKSIRLGVAYFVPEELAVREFLDARKRGVQVEIIVPGPHIDTKVVRRASRARWGPLLEAGCEIYEFEPTMYHCKAMIVDDLLVSVGSTNFDNRSFRLNDEANMNVLDEAFARQMAQVFEQDKQRSRRITLEAWQNRPWKEKMIEHLADLLGPQL